MLAFAILASSVFAADYTSYIGDEFPYLVTAITTDSAGNTYITGSRNGVMEPNSAVTGIVIGFANSAPPPSPPPPDVFVTKLDLSGNIVFTTTISGKGSDQANAIALDPSGNIYIAGTTTSANFPLRDPLQASAGLSFTGFIVKLSPDGSTIYAYLGGTLGPSSVNALAVDAKGNLYVTGYTYASDFSTTPGLPAGPVRSQGAAYISGAFFAKITSAGDQVLYSGLIAGQPLPCTTIYEACGSNTFGVGIAVDASGSAYVAGNANTGGLVGTTGSLLAQGAGAFVAKVNTNGTALSYLTFLSATNDTSIAAIAVDPAGDVYMTGSTTDPRFLATPNSFQTVFAGPAGSTDAFVAKLKPDGSAMVWATYLGGAAADAGQSLAVDALGDVWVAGITSSSTFPNANGWTQGGDFLVEVNATGSALSYSALFPSGSAAQAVALDAGGTVHISGQGGLVSTITPAQPFATRIFGIVNAASGPIAGRISPGELISIYGPALGPASSVIASPDSSGFYPKSLGGVEVTIDGIAAPLLYVSSTQINVVVPFGVTLGVATVQVSSASSTVPAFRAMVDSTAPGIFTNGGGSAVNQDGSINSASHPARVNSLVSIWATGMGVAPRTDGQVVTSAHNDCSSCSAYVDYSSVGVLYAGAAPGLVAGVAQIDFVMPATATSRSVPVTVAAGGRSSGSVVVFVAP